MQIVLLECTNIDNLLHIYLFYGQHARCSRVIVLEIVNVYLFPQRTEIVALTLHGALDLTSQSRPNVIAYLFIRHNQTNATQTNKCNTTLKLKPTQTFNFLTMQFTEIVNTLMNLETLLC